MFPKETLEPRGVTKETLRFCTYEVLEPTYLSQHAIVPSRFPLQVLRVSKTQ